LGCYTEHSGTKTELSDPTFCVACHEDLKVKNDPIKVTHAELIKNNDWETCLSCHDFHGNHNRETPTLQRDAIEIEALLDYLGDGPDPYSSEKIFKAETK
jgi:nitrate/TMAO reductase-like tetraheme cytochrome c subunit